MNAAYSRDESTTAGDMSNVWIIGSCDTTSEASDVLTQMYENPECAGTGSDINMIQAPGAMDNLFSTPPDLGFRDDGIKYGNLFYLLEGAGTTQGNCIELPVDYRPMDTVTYAKVVITSSGPYNAYPYLCYGSYTWPSPPPPTAPSPLPPPPMPTVACSNADSGLGMDGVLGAIEFYYITCGNGTEFSFDDSTCAGVIGCMAKVMPVAGTGVNPYTG